MKSAKLIVATTRRFKTRARGPAPCRHVSAVTSRHVIERSAHWGGGGSGGEGKVGGRG